MGELEGFTGLTENICLAHIIDPALLSRVSDSADRRECSYCDRTGAVGEPPFAVSMDVVGRLVFEAATWLYHDGFDEFFHDGYQEQYETEFVVEDVTSRAFAPEVIDLVVSHITESIASPYAWVDSGLYEDFLLSWESFAETVKHQSRFVYVGARERPGRRSEPPAIVSRFLDGLAAYVQNDMLTRIEPGEKLYRARMVEDMFRFLGEVRDDPAKHLGPAPAGKAPAGRLNPEGVGLFYGATSADVAVRETALHSPYDDAVVGGFIVQRPLVILDFTKEPALPSLFAHHQRRRFIFARFASEFVKRITQSVRLTGQERIEYVVTQVIGEYFRWAPEMTLDGIAWESHLIRPGELGKNVLVWASADDVRSDPPAIDDKSSSPLWVRTFGAPAPILTLSQVDVKAYQAQRFVEVSGPVLPGDDDPSPMTMDV